MLKCLWKLFGWKVRCGGAEDGLATKDTGRTKKIYIVFQKLIPIIFRPFFVRRCPPGLPFRI